MRPGEEFIPAPHHDWLRPLEYGLIGLVAVMGAATLALVVQAEETEGRRSQLEQALEQPAAETWLACYR